MTARSLNAQLLLPSCRRLKSNVFCEQEGLQSTGDPAALQRARYVMSNAEEQLLRAKGQVARLHGDPVPNQSLTEEVCP